MNRGIPSYVDDAPELILSFDRNYKCELANQRALQFLGRKLEDIVGRPPEDLGSLGSELLVHLRDPKPHQVIDLECQDADGQLHYLEALIYLGADASINVLARSSQNKRDQVELKQQYEAQSRALHIFDIVAETDRRGIITYVNDRFVEISGYAREELIGNDHRIVNSGFHPKSFFKDMWSTISRGYTWSGEIRNRTKDGRFYWVSTVIAPVLDVRGQIRKYLSVRRDITRQKEQEEHLRESELRYRELLDQIPWVAIGVDLQGRITFANQALQNLLGKSLEELSGRDWFFEFISKADRDRLLDIHAQVLNEDPRASSFECEILDHQGKPHTIVFTNTIFRSPAGDIIGVTSIGEDVTEKLLNEKHLREANEKIERQRQEVMAFVSHELRSPLMSIRMCADLMREFSEGAPSDPRFPPDQILKRIHSEVSRIDRISRDLMEGVIYGSGDLKYDFRKSPLAPILQNVCSKFQESLSSRPEIRLRLEPVEASLSGNWDPNRLDQVLSNLISNAIKYSKPQGNDIQVRARKEKDLVHLEISDQGLGIPSDNLQSIFGLFSRASNVKGGKTQGFGLGLKIAKDIIEKHRGKIWAESELGVGSTFHILLPL